MRALQIKNLPISENRIDFCHYTDNKFKKLVVYVDHQNSNTYYEISYRLDGCMDVHRITFPNVHEALTFYNELGLK